MHTKTQHGRKKSVVAEQFIHTTTGMVPEESGSVKREHKVGIAGNVDILIETRLTERDSILLIE